MKIIVTGSLGNISKPLTQDLAKKGHTVTVISTKVNRQKEIEALGVKAAIGSVEDAAFLTTTFTGADAVYCMIPPSFSENNQVAYYKRIGNSYAKAITEANIKRVVHLSSWGAHLDKGTGIILGSHNVENILDGLRGVDITHLRAGSIYYNLYGFINMIKTAGFIGANYGGDDKIVWVAPEDIASAAAEELVKITGVQKVRYVASDERTANETAKVLGAAIGKPNLTWRTFTDEQAKQGMLQNGLPPSIVDDLAAMYTSIHNGKMGEDYERNKPENMGKIKVEDFAIVFKEVYNKK